MYIVHYIDSSSILPENDFTAIENNPKNIYILFFSIQTSYDSCLIQTSFIRSRFAMHLTQIVVFLVFVLFQASIEVTFEECITHVNK